MPFPLERDRMSGFLHRDDRAISPVVGVALMLALVVVLAAVRGGLLLGIEPPADPTLQYSHGTEYHADSSGNEERWDAVWTTAGPLTVGDDAHIDGYGSDSALNPACEGETYRFVHRPGDGESAVLATVEIDQPAVGPAAVHR